ncbi:hypothetical protein MishRS11D_26220 [Methylomagnum ishizawai]|nr:hypothetical protein MishRS11D_26220 [Methylomagnum ishizawai]
MGGRVRRGAEETPPRPEREGQNQEGEDKQEHGVSQWGKEGVESNPPASGRVGERHGFWGVACWPIRRYGMMAFPAETAPPPLNPMETVGIAPAGRTWRLFCRFWRRLAAIPENSINHRIRKPL